MTTFVCKLPIINQHSWCNKNIQMEGQDSGDYVCPKPSCPKDTSHTKCADSNHDKCVSNPVCEWVPDGTYSFCQKKRENSGGVVLQE